MTGAYGEFSQAAASVWGFSRGTTGSSGSLSYGARGRSTGMGQVHFVGEMTGAAEQASQREQISTGSLST